jgi:hypothetical protein
MGCCELAKSERIVRGQQTLAFERVKYGKVQHETQQTPASGATNSHFMSKLLEFGWF